MHEPLARMIGATQSHALTLINWLIDWLIDGVNSWSKVPLRTWHIAWLRYVTLNSLLENCKTIQQNTIFYIFLLRWRKKRLSISSFSKLVGCQSERKLRSVHWRWEDERRSFNATTCMDLTVTCEWFDFGSEMFLALIALLMVCNVSVIY